MRRPLPLVAVCLAAGVWIGDAAPPWVAALGALAIAGSAVLLRRRLHANGAAVVLIGALLFAFGAWRIAPIGEARDWPRIDPDSARGALVTLTGTVSRYPDYRPGKVRVVLTDVALDGDVEPPDFAPRVLLTLIGDEPGVSVGDRIRIRAYLRRPIGYRNEGGFDIARYHRLNGVDALAVPVGRSAPEVIARGYGSIVLRAVGRLRDRIRAAIDGRFGVPEKEVLKALVIGEKNRLDEGLQETYRAAGLAHVLAISGFHVGVVAALAYALFWFLLTRSERLALRFGVHKIAALLTFAPMVLYVLLAGMRISTVRAGIMIGALLVAMAIDRARDAASAIALAAIAILLVDPAALFGASFQLSFAAVIGIFFVLWRWSAARRDPGGEPAPWTWRRGIALYLLVSVAANLATLPITAATFNRVSLAGLIANPILVPVVAGVGIPLVLLGTVSVFVYEPLSAVFYYAALLVIRASGAVMEWFAGLPGAWRYVPTPRLPEVVCAYVFLGSLALVRRVRWAKWTAAGAIAVGVAFSVWAARAERLDGDWRVTFLDVGQGDATLVELNTAGGVRRVLVDGGGVERGTFDVGKAVVAPVLWYRRINRLDLAVATHSHPDHADGLRFICSHFDVGEFWWNGLRGGDRRFAELLAIVESRGIPARVVNSDTEPRDGAPAEFRVLFPPPEFADPARCRPSVRDGRRPGEGAWSCPRRSGRSRPSSPAENVTVRSLEERLAGRRVGECKALERKRGEGHSGRLHGQRGTKSGNGKVARRGAEGNPYLC